MAFLDDIKGAVESAVCFTLSSYDKAFGWLGGPNPAAGARGAFCDNPKPPDPPPSPFNGGQCEGVEYEVSLLLAGTSTTLQTTLFGPITQLTWQVEEDLPNGDQRGRFIRSGRNAQGAPVTLNQERTYGASQLPVSTQGPTRVDGQPDDCGDPPPPPPPPYIPEPITEPIPDPDGGPDIDVDITLFAPIIIGGNVFAPVRITGPTFNLDGRINLSPNFDIDVGINLGGGSTGGGVDGQGDGTPVPEEPTDIDEDSPDEPEQCKGKELLGLHISLNFAPGYRATDVEQDGDIGAIAVPRVATLYFVARMGGSTNLLPGIDLKLRSQYIPVPPNVFVDCWRLNLEDNISVFSIRPVFKTTAPPPAE